MKKAGNGQVIGIPVSTIVYEAEMLTETYCSSRVEQNRKDAGMTNWMSRFSKKAKNCAQSIREYVTLGLKKSKRKRILQSRVAGRAFRENFSVIQGEKLVKDLQCYLSTSAGPISGMLFISTEKVAFRSDESFTVTSSKGDTNEVPYKVLIPLNRIKRVNRSMNTEKPSEKYVQIVTVDEFEFWFVGVVSHQKSLKRLPVEKAKSGSQVMLL